MKYLVIAALVLLSGAPLEAQVPGFSSTPAAAVSKAGTIGVARELYAAARYDEALAVLNGLSPSDNTPADERKTIEQYRSLCLLALGRATEAEAAIAAVVRLDPFYQPSEAEASPRVRTTFSEVRHTLLPDIASSLYSDAKVLYDRKEFAAAAARFRALVALLDDPQMDNRRPDMRTLAAGFVELAAAAAAPPPPPEPKSEPVPERPPAPAAPEPRIYSADDDGVVPPVTIRQDVPAVPAAISGMTKNLGIVDLVIDEHGRVISINLRARVHPIYDTALMNAAREWKYQPATVNGTPVKFRKLLQISVKR